MPTADELANDVVRALCGERAGHGHAVLLEGPWGSGKTWLWQNRVRSDNAIGSRPYAYASLMGVQNIEQLTRRLFWYALQSDKAESFSKMVMAGFKRLASATRKVLASRGGLELSRSAFDSLDIMPEGTVICLDDLERAHESFSLKDIFGAIDFLATTRKCVVLAICNSDEVAKGKAESWATLSERVFLRRVRIPASDDAYNHTLGAYSGRLADLEIDEVRRIFEHAGEHNLRRLDRVCRYLAEIRRHFNAPIPKSMIGCLYLLQTDFEKGALKDHTEYSNPSTLSPFHKRDNLSQEAQVHSYMRISNFFGAIHDYGYYPELRTLISEGRGIEGLERYFFPKGLSPSEKLLDVVSGNKASFMSDHAATAWCVEVLELLAGDNAVVPWDDMVFLYGQLVDFDNVLQSSFASKAAVSIQAALPRVALQNLRGLGRTLLGSRNPKVKQDVDAWIEVVQDLIAQRKLERVREICAQATGFPTLFDGRGEIDTATLVTWVGHDHATILAAIEDHRAIMHEIFERFSQNVNKANPHVAGVLHGLEERLHSCDRQCKALFAGIVARLREMVPSDEGRREEDVLSQEKEPLPLVEGDTI